MRLRAKQSATYRLQHVDGEVITTNALNTFCVERDLDPRWLRRVLRGTRKSYKGWSAYTEQEAEVPKKQRLQHTSGEIAEFTSVADWCRERKLEPRPFYAVLRGARKSHLGWSVVGQRTNLAARVRSPNGEIYLIDTIRGFATQHRLDYSNLRKLLAGKLKKTKGWTLAGKVFIH